VAVLPVKATLARAGCELQQQHTVQPTQYDYMCKLWTQRVSNNQTAGQLSMLTSTATHNSKQRLSFQTLAAVDTTHAAHIQNTA
jgi:hypothetical protein